MKRADLIQRITDMGHKLEVVRTGFKRWTFLTGEAYYDLMRLKVSDFGRLAIYATETGILIGPESSTRRQYFRIFGFIFIVDGVCDFSLASSSLLRNSRYRVGSSRKLIATRYRKAS